MRHFACTGEMRNVYTILVRKLEGNRSLEVLDMDGRVMLKWILGK
jgi:hypothetical protein